METIVPTAKLDTHLISSDVCALCKTNMHTNPATAPTASLSTTAQNEPKFRLVATRTTRNANADQQCFGDIQIRFLSSRGYAFRGLRSILLMVTGGLLTSR